MSRPSVAQRPLPLSLPRLSLGVACALLALVLAPRAAHAQNPAAAEALFEQARVAMAQGSFDIACARFRDSDKLDPAVGTRFNLADCEERRGRLATAWSLFRGVVAELGHDDDRRPIAEQRAAALKARVPQLTMVLAPETPPGVRVRIDGVELGEGSFGVPLPMDPGEHALVVLAPGGERRAQTSSFSLAEGEQMDLPIRFVGSTGEPAAPAQAESPSEAEPGAEPGGGTAQVGRPSARRKWGYVVGSAGAAGILIGGITGVVALSKKSTADENCSDVTRTCAQAGVDASDSGRTYATLSTVGFAVGLVGLAAGAYLVLTSPSDARDGASARRAAGPALRAEVNAAPGRGFLSVSGAF